MPGQVLTVVSMLVCNHPPGKLTFTTPPVHKLKVGGQPVLLQTDLTTGQIAGCTQPAPTAGPGPCVAVGTVTKGPSTKLKVGGVPVLLSDLAAVTLLAASTPGGTLKANPPGTKLSAV